jgi:hypothetical protein
VTAFRQGRAHKERYLGGTTARGASSLHQRYLLLLKLPAHAHFRAIVSDEVCLRYFWLMKLTIDMTKDPAQGEAE